MEALISVLLLTGKVFFGFFLFIIALAITTSVFARLWFSAKYMSQLRYRMALEDYRAKRSDEHWSKRNKKRDEGDDD